MRKRLLISIGMGTLFFGWGCQQRTRLPKHSLNLPTQSKPLPTRTSSTVSFSSGDRMIIAKFTQENQNSFSSEPLEKNQPPSELRRKLRRNDKLSLSLQKKLKAFPKSLKVQLKTLPSGARHAFLGNHALILSAGNVILDVFLYH